MPIRKVTLLILALSLTTTICGAARLGLSRDATLVMSAHAQDAAPSHADSALATNTLAVGSTALAADTASQDPRLEVLAHDPLGGRGLNADVWLHHGFAYVGTWAAASDRLRGCPGT